MSLFLCGVVDQIRKGDAAEWKDARRRVERMQGNEKLKRKILEERNRHKEKRGKE